MREKHKIQYKNQKSSKTFNVIGSTKKKKKTQRAGRYPLWKDKMVISWELNERTTAFLYPLINSH